MDLRFDRIDTPFAITKVDADGVMYYDIYAIEDDLSVLNGKPITNKEWLQVVDFFKELNAGGFYHTDLPANLYFKRTASGKLKMTVLDFDFFEEYKFDMESLRHIENELMRFGVKEGPSIAVYD